MKTQVLQLSNLNQDTLDLLKTLCRESKNLYNCALYEVRQHFFESKKYFNYFDVCKKLKAHEHYKSLYSQSAQQTLKYVDRSFKSFFSLLKKKNKGKYEAKVKLPKYLDKDGYFPLIMPAQHIKIKGSSFRLLLGKSMKKQYSDIWLPFPSNLDPESLVEIRIVPKYNGQLFEIHYVTDSKIFQKPELDYSLVLGIDLGLNNLVAAVSNTGESFLISGKPIKSANQWYNKENSRLQSFRDKLKLPRSKRQIQLLNRRNNQVKDYIHKTAWKVIEYCLDRRIGTLVIGQNKEWKDGSNMGARNNQNFLSIPHARLIKRIEELAEIYGIRVQLTEESYTSKASFLDGDTLPVYGQSSEKKTFSGKRTKRGLYQTAKNWLINADLNGAANIIRKVSMNLGLDLSRVSRDVLNRPIRINIFGSYESPLLAAE